jgi:endonuclease/exonuclease/phosphatase family metal-dependent hydrolase
MKMLWAIVIFFLATSFTLADQDAVSLFDGRSLGGWHGDPHSWSVQDGTIVGRLDANGPGKAFLIHDQAFSDFELAVEFRLSAQTVNSGIQFRSEELAKDSKGKPAPFMMSGYQADISEKHLGALVGERDGRGIIGPVAKAAKNPLQQRYRSDGWNEYVIRAHGHHLSLSINGVKTVELDDPIGAEAGLIGLQVQGEGAIQVSFRNIRIRRLDPPAATKAPETDPSALKVMTFNIRYGTANDGGNNWNRRRGIVVAAVQEFDPDLLGTQETLAFQKQYLTEQLKEMESFGVGREDGKEKGEMTAVFYRKSRFEKLDGGHFWLSLKPAVPGSKSWDSSLTRMATWLKLKDRQAPGQPVIWFLNAHFDHRGEEARLNSARLIRQRIENVGSGAATVLTGDFNTPEGSPPHTVFFGPEGRPPLVDAFRLAHRERSPNEGTYNGFNLGTQTGGRIDWIGVTKRLEVLSADIDRFTKSGHLPSDHFPVTAILKYRE